MNSILSGKNISKSAGGQTILDNISLDVYESDFTVIMGASGAGKSTLIYALSGMDSITSGHVLYKGKDIGKLNEKQMAEHFNGDP